MKSLSCAIGVAAALALSSASAQAESRNGWLEFLDSKEPLLRVQTFETPHGDYHRSYIFGYPVRGDVEFRNEHRRDTRKEGYAPQRRK